MQARTRPSGPKKPGSAPDGADSRATKGESVAADRPAQLKKPHRFHKSYKRRGGRGKHQSPLGLTRELVGCEGG